jgi:hypothetical protein
VEFAKAEDHEVFEQQQEFVEGKSFIHSCLPNTTNILITLFILLLMGST